MLPEDHFLSKAVAGAQKLIEWHEINWPKGTCTVAPLDDPFGNLQVCDTKHH